MASNRYGQIWHGDRHYINIRFPSTEARLKFASEFETYHASHDHEGDVPTFKNVTSKELGLGTGSRSPEDLVKAETNESYRITIDGYPWNEIHKYHNPSGFSDYFWYRVPTCCVPPVIVIDHKFVDSGTLERHPLSAIFGDMPGTDFESLLESVQMDGFIDPFIRIYEGKILDGWHRYRAASELNLIRRLRFQEWNTDEHRDGDPKVFVLGRNIERRHLSASQRAQIVVTFNERFGHGGDRSKGSNETLKPRQELAQEAGVSKSSITRAIAVEKAGQSEAVIAGEKTASKVIEEETLRDLWKQIDAEIPQWKRRDKERCRYEEDHIGRASKSMLIQALRAYNHNDSSGAANRSELGQLLRYIKTDKFSFILRVRKILSNGTLSDDREAAQLLKKKKKVLKDIWDARKQAATDYVGNADTDLNQYLSLEQLEKGFAKSHEYLANAFRSGMERTSFSGVFETYQERAVESGVSLEDLQEECRAMQTYAYDILIWERQEWIQQMIQQKRTQAKSSPSETSADTAADGGEVGRLPTANPLGDRAETPITSPPSDENAPDKIHLDFFSDAYFSARADLELMLEDMEICEYSFYDTALDRFALENSRIFDPLDEIRRDVKNPNTYQHWCEILLKLRKCIEEKAGWVTELMPKRELSLVSIGIDVDADDFELVEFTGEDSDEICCPLEELPEHIREALLEIAVKQIQEARKNEVYSDMGKG